MVTKPGARKGPIRPSWWRIGASWAIRVVILVIGKLQETHWLRISSDLKEACKNHFCCTSSHLYPIFSIMKSLTFAGLFGDLCLGSGRVGRGNDPHWVFMGGNGGSGGTQQEETNPSFSTNLLKICRATYRGCLSDIHQEIFIWNGENEARRVRKKPTGRGRKHCLW